MELTPAIPRLDKRSMMFLLDKSVASGNPYKVTPNYMTLKDVSPKTVSNDAILRIAKKKDLTVVTRNRRLIIQAILKRQNIVFVDEYKRWHFVRSSETEMLGRRW